MSADPELLTIIKKYFDAIENADPEESLQFFAPDVVQEEFPNRLVPSGAKRDLAALREGAHKGRKVVTSQHFEILHAMIQGDSAAVETLWTATLAVPLGTIPAGGQMRARFAVFFEFREGKILRQRNYDCFDPF